MFGNQQERIKTMSITVTAYFQTLDAKKYNRIEQLGNQTVDSVQDFDGLSAKVNAGVQQVLREGKTSTEYLALPAVGGKQHWKIRLDATGVPGTSDSDFYYYHEIGGHNLRDVFTLTKKALQDKASDLGFTGN